VAFFEQSLSVDFHQKKAAVVFHNAATSSLVNISNIDFQEHGSHTEDEAKLKVRWEARRVLMELLEILPD
jgi:hypothetical protein